MVYCVHISYSCSRCGSGMRRTVSCGNVSCSILYCTWYVQHCSVFAATLHGCQYDGLALESGWSNFELNAIRAGCVCRGVRLV
jgi:hypothetical protein